MDFEHIRIVAVVGFLFGSDVLRYVFVFVVNGFCGADFAFRAVALIMQDICWPVLDLFSSVSLGNGCGLQRAAMRQIFSRLCGEVCLARDFRDVGSFRTHHVTKCICHCRSAGSFAIMSLLKVCMTELWASLFTTRCMFI